LPLLILKLSPLTPKAIKEKILSCKGGRDMLIATGFEPRPAPNDDAELSAFFVLPDTASLADLAEVWQAIDASQ
jgi:hypothetical protein